MSEDVPRRGDLRNWLGGVCILMAAACSGGDGSVPEIVLSADDCSYSGPGQVNAGSVTAVIQLNNLGHSALSIVRLDDEMTYAELVDYYSDPSGSVPDPPGWVDELVYFEVVKEGGDRVGEGRTFTVEEGIHAVVCIDFWGAAGPTARPVAEIRVSRDMG